MARRVLLFIWLALAGTLAAAAAPVLAPAHFNDGQAVDTLPVGTRTPLLLVHGLGGSVEGWENLLRAYEQDPSWRGAFKLYTFRYSTSADEVNADPSAPRSISALGAALRDAMQGFYDQPTAAPHFGFGDKPVVVLAHSMGGLVARSMMQEHAFLDGQRGGHKVLHLVTLGTPHHGSPLVDAALVFGLGTVSELTDTYRDFLKQLTWTNYDSLNMIGGRCNPWLAQLNNYAPSSGATYGRCGAIAATPLPGFYEKMIVYGTASLQDKESDSGAVGVYKPGSASNLSFTSSYLRNAFGRSYANDGIVPMASAQFHGRALWQQGEALDCDHRYIKRGYLEFVRSATATYTDWAFCRDVGSAAVVPSGTSGGLATGGTIFGVPGGIIDTITTASEAERVFDWAEQAYAGYLQPAGAVTGISGEYYFRHYPESQAYVGIRDGHVYYMGPASSGDVLAMGSLADFLAQAQGAGF